MSKSTTTALALILLMAADVVWAQAPSPATQHLLAQLEAGSTLERFLERGRAEFRRLDADGDDRLTAGDDAMHAAIRRAQTRTFAALHVLRADLDGVGSVTADELRRLLHYQHRSEARRGARRRRRRLSGSSRRSRS